MNLIITGHNLNKEYFEKAWRANRFPQSLLFSGSKSIGKFSLSINLASQIFINQNISFSSHLPQQRETERIVMFMHPSLLVIGNDESKEITVDEVREINRFLSLTSAETKYRMVIIDNAENMNLNAQNSLLKILEEPPQNSILILISHSPDRLLLTIRSRVIESKFLIPSPEEIKLIIQEKNINLDYLIRIGFTPGIIKQWVDLSLFNLYKVLLQYVSSIQTSSSLQIYKSLDEIQKKQKIEFKHVLEGINFLNRRILESKLNLDLVSLIDNEIEMLSQITQRPGIGNLLMLQSYISDLTIDYLKFNLDLRQLIILIFAKYRELL